MPIRAPSPVVRGRRAPPETRAARPQPPAGAFSLPASAGRGETMISDTQPITVVPGEILDRAAALQREHGSAYDMPFGTDLFRKTVVEDYWRLNPLTGLGPENVLATVGGRDALVRAYDAMLALGHGRTGDLVVVTRVPWISYNWGPYGIGANVLLAPGSPAEGWAYTEEGLRACAESAARLGRKIAGVIVTSPDNPPRKEPSPERQGGAGRGG